MDHVLIAVPDTRAAAALFRERFGLSTILPGGSPFPGVANAVIPLGPPAYIELVMATDPSATLEAAAIATVAEGGGFRLFTWVIEPIDLGTVATRLGVHPDGEPGRAGRPSVASGRTDRSSSGTARSGATGSRAG